MSTKDYPSIEKILQCFRYENGKLFWLVRPRDHFASNQSWKRWNKLYSGKEAGCDSKHKNDFRWIVCINYIRFFRHVVVWAMHHGEWKLRIDHKDNDSLNDRIENLRPATRSQNMANSLLSKNNTSGQKGVSWHKRQRKWIARIMVDRKPIQLGSFDDPIEAKAAYDEAAKKYFGEFACVG